jgi:hypothetical protein
MLVAQYHGPAPAWPKTALIVGGSSQTGQAEQNLRERRINLIVVKI